MLGGLTSYVRNLWTGSRPAPPVAETPPAHDRSVFISHMRYDNGQLHVSATNAPQQFVAMLAGEVEYTSRMGKTIRFSPSHKVEMTNAEGGWIDYLVTPLSEGTVSTIADPEALRQEYELYSMLKREGVRVPGIKFFGRGKLDLENRGDNFFVHTNHFWLKPWYGAEHDDRARAQYLPKINDALALTREVNAALHKGLGPEQKRQLLEKQYHDTAAKANVAVEEVRKHYHAHRMIAALGTGDPGFINNCAPLEKILDHADKSYGGCYWDNNPTNIVVDDQQALSAVDFGDSCPRSLPETITALVDEYYPRQGFLTQANYWTTPIREEDALDIVEQQRREHCQKTGTQIPQEEFLAAYHAARVVTSIRNYGYAARKAKAQAGALEGRIKSDIHETLYASERPGNTYDRFYDFYHAQQRKYHFAGLAMQSLSSLKASMGESEDAATLGALKDSLYQHMCATEAQIPDSVKRMCVSWTRHLP